MNHIVLNKYAVEFKDSTVRIFEAKTIEDLCFSIADYFGFNTDLFKICMNGCKTCEENILITNEWLINKSSYYDKIVKVYLISSILWEGK